MKIHPSTEKKITAWLQKMFPLGTPDSLPIGHILITPCRGLMKSELAEYDLVQFDIHYVNGTDTFLERNVISRSQIHSEEE